MSNEEDPPERVWIGEPFQTQSGLRYGNYRDSHQQGWAEFARVHSPTGRCIHCDTSFVPTGPDDWCNSICHNKEHIDPAPTGKVSKGDEALVKQIVDSCKFGYADNELEEGSAENPDVIEASYRWLNERFTSALATVRKEAREAAFKEVVKAAKVAQSRVGAGRNCYDAPDEAESVAKFMLEAIERAAKEN